MDQFTVSSLSLARVEVNKSKFIAMVFPISDEESFKKKLDEVKKEHPKAKHYVYAYRIGMKSKSCDDREPKGTGGRPILEFLNKKNLNNVAIIVVRYFGGTELGASRLLRTYLSSAIEAVNNSVVVKLD